MEYRYRSGAKGREQGGYGMDYRYKSRAKGRGRRDLVWSIIPIRSKMMSRAGSWYIIEIQ